MPRSGSKRKTAAVASLDTPPAASATSIDGRTDGGEVAAGPAAVPATPVLGRFTAEERDGEHGEACRQQKSPTRAMQVLRMLRARLEWAASGSGGRGGRTR